MIIKRVIFGLVLFGAIFNAPWWFAFILAFAGTFYFHNYYEVFVFGILVDFLYGVAGGIFFGFGLMGLIISGIIFWGAERAKRELRR